MNAQELRIGNYVNVPNKKQTPFKVDYFDDAKVYKENGTYTCEPFGEIPMHPLTWDLEQCSGIPLTPEILEKVGLDFLDTEMSGNTVYCIPNTNWRIAYSYRDNKEFKLWHKQVSPPTWNLKTFNYVHELQNLVFVLTGGDLS